MTRLKIFTCLFYIYLSGLLSLDVFAQGLDDLPINKSILVIYDNDDCRDVYTDEYLLALSHLGKIKLAGIITTYSSDKVEYNLFCAGREEIVHKAEQSGMNNLPKVFKGTDKRLVQPVSSRIEDTAPIDLPASKFIVECTKDATYSKPLVIISGGQLTVIANAYLLDNSITDKIIVSGVFGVEKMDYNAGLDSWAWKIVLSKFRVFAVPVGPSDNQRKVYMKAPVVLKEEIKSKLSQSNPFFIWMFEKPIPSMLCLMVMIMMDKEQFPLSVQIILPVLKDGRLRELTNMVKCCS